MFYIPYCLGAIILILTLTKSKEEHFEDFNWIKEHEIQSGENFQSFQTIIMIDRKINDDEESLLAEILKSTVSTRPARVINFREEKAQEFRASVASRSIQTTTQFLTILDGKTDPKKALEYLIEVSGGATHPRCLMIILIEEKIINREEFLRFAWSKNILDLTILEVRRNSTRNLFWDDRQTFAVIHRFNPFNETYTRKNYSVGELIFPNKLDDMKGFEMKVFTMQSVPNVYVERNLSGYTIKASGLEVNLRQVLSKLQNFRVSEVSYPGLRVGRASCQRNKSTGILFKLYHNEFQFITNPLIVPSDCKEYANTFALTYDNYRYLVLVPIPRSGNKLFSVTKTSLVMGLLTCCLVLFICMFTRILKMDKQFWQFFSIFQLLLGYSVPRNVTKNADRIMLPFVLFGFLILSSELFSLLTHIEIMIESEDKLNTLEDLNKTNLIPFTSRNVRDALSALKNVNVVKDLIKKARVYPNEDYCLQELLKFRNVSCVLKETGAQLAVSKYLTKKRQAIMKTLSEPFLETPRAIAMEPNSPNAFRFEKNINRITQSGLKEKWIHDLFFSVATGKSDFSLMEDQSTLLIVLFWILVAGFTISLLVFFGELLMKSVRNVHV